jgi:hypothetical protein
VTRRWRDRVAEGIGLAELDSSSAATPTTSSKILRVFISYTRDSPRHVRRILRLAAQLRAEGIDAQLDLYTPHPEEGWPLWTRRQLVDAEVSAR